MNDTENRRQVLQSLIAGAKRFCSNPVIGFLVGLVGVGLAVYFYWAGQAHRELRYFVHPVKAAVVRTGTASRLKVTYDGKPVDSDITAAQIAIWNSGKLPIRSEHVLKNIEIHTTDGSPILEAVIRKQSRDVVGLVLNNDSISSGKLGISWRILEKGDGGVIQLVYAAGSNIEIEMAGIIEGQKQITGVRYPKPIKTATEQYEDKSGKSMMVVAAIVIAAQMLYALVRLPFHWKRHSASKNIQMVIIIITGFTICGTIVWRYVISMPSGPPFGF